MGDRYDELIGKRRRVGLSDEEANELGRLMAERAGRGDEYGNAANPPPGVRAVRATGTDEAELQDLHAREKAKEDAQPEEEAGAGTPRDVDDTVMDRRRIAASEKDFPPPA